MIGIWTYIVHTQQCWSADGSNITNQNWNMIWYMITRWLIWMTGTGWFFFLTFTVIQYFLIWQNTGISDWNFSWKKLIFDSYDDMMKKNMINWNSSFWDIHMILELPWHINFSAGSSYHVDKIHETDDPMVTKTRTHGDFYGDRANFIRHELYVNEESLWYFNRAM